MRYFLMVMQDRRASIFPIFKFLPTRLRSFGFISNFLFFFFLFLLALQMKREREREKKKTYTIFPPAPKPNGASDTNIDFAHSIYNRGYYREKISFFASRRFGNSRSAAHKRSIEIKTSQAILQKFPIMQANAKKKKTLSGT